MGNYNKISVVLGTYNRLSFLKLTIESIRIELKYFDHEIIVVDGGSTDGTLKWLLKQKDIINIIQHNRGIFKGKPIKRRSWGYFMNLGFKCAEGKYICMLSDDCLIIPGAIINGHKLFEKKLEKGKKVGAMAFYWRNWPEDINYRVGLTLDKKMFVNHGLYLKIALEDVNYIDEDTYNFYHADGDLCLKMWQKGYECIESPDSFIEHYSHANTTVRKSNGEKEKEDWVNYLKKWSGIFYDPKDTITGNLVQKSYSDLFNTANKFKRADFFRYFIVQQIKIILKMIFCKLKSKSKIYTL